MNVATLDGRELELETLDVEVVKVLEVVDIMVVGVEVVDD
jgi:hypothetical protein